MVELNLGEGSPQGAAPKGEDRPCCHPPEKLEKDLEPKDYSAGVGKKVATMPAEDPDVKRVYQGSKITVCIDGLPPTTLHDAVLEVTTFPARELKGTAANDATSFEASIPHDKAYYVLVEKHPPVDAGPSRTGA